MWWKAALCAGAWEAAWWAMRVSDRTALYREAFALSRQIGKPLLVVGAPDLGATGGPGYGDMVVDIRPSSCPNSFVADITERIPLGDDSCVVFVSCVLEYVSDLHAALRELRRVAGDRVFICRVQPWTLAAYLYPGARRTLDSSVLSPPLLTAGKYPLAAADGGWYNNRTGLK